MRIGARSVFMRGLDEENRNRVCGYLKEERLVYWAVIEGKERRTSHASAEQNKIETGAWSQRAKHVTLQNALKDYRAICGAWNVHLELAYTWPRSRPSHH